MAHCPITAVVLGVRLGGLTHRCKFLLLDYRHAKSRFRTQTLSSPEQLEPGKKPVIGRLIIDYILITLAQKTSLELFNLWYKQGKHSFFVSDVVDKHAQRIIILK